MNERLLLYQKPEVIHPRAIDTLRANPEWFIQNTLLGTRTDISVLRQKLFAEERIWGVFGTQGHVYTLGCHPDDIVELKGFRPDPPWFKRSPYAQELIQAGAFMRFARLSTHNKAILFATKQEHQLFYYLSTSTEGSFVSYQQLVNNYDLGIYRGNMDIVLNNFQHVLDGETQCPLTIERRNRVGVRLVVK